MSLIEHLQKIRDFRTQPRYPLWVVLLLVIMGTMIDSGNDYLIAVKANQPTLFKHLNNQFEQVAKDVVLKEDDAPLCDGYAPANESYRANYCTESVSSGGFRFHHQGASTFIS